MSSRATRSGEASGEVAFWFVQLTFRLGFLRFPSLLVRRMAGPMELASLRMTSLGDIQRLEQIQREKAVLEELNAKERVDLKRVMRRRYSARSEEESKLLFDFVSSVKFFRQALAAGTVSKETVVELCKEIEMRVYNKDQIIFKQGEVGDSFFLVLEGMCHVLLDPAHVKEEEGSREDANIHAEAVAAVQEVVDDRVQNKLQAAVDDVFDPSITGTRSEDVVSDGNTKDSTIESKIDKVSKVGEKEFEDKKREWMRRKKQVVVEETVPSLLGHIRVAIVQDGGSFGDLALLNDEPRSASVVAKAHKNYCLVLKRDVYERAILTLQREMMASRVQFLKNIHAFHRWDKHETQAIANLLELTQHSAGEVICKEGDLAEYFIMVKSGEGRLLKKLKVSAMHFYGDHMEKKNAPHLIHQVHHDETDHRPEHHRHHKKKRLKKYCFVELGTLKKYDMFGHVALLPKSEHVRNFTAIETEQITSAKDTAHLAGDVHAHHHECSFVASSHLEVYRLSRHDFGRRLPMFLKTLSPFIEFERTEDEVTTQHLETEEWELYKSAVTDEVLKNSAKSKRVESHAKYVGQHYQPPKPRLLPTPPRLHRGHYHDHMLEYLEKRQHVRHTFLSGKLQQDEMKKLISPLSKRVSDGNHVGHATPVADMKHYESHMDKRDTFWANQKHRPHRIGEIHHIDEHASAWDMNWEQPHSPFDVRYRRLMHAYERRRLRNRSINRLRKVAVKAGESEWKLQLNTRKAPKLKAAVQSMQAMLISTFSKKRDVVSDAFRSV